MVISDNDNLYSATAMPLQVSLTVN